VKRAADTAFSLARFEMQVSEDWVVADAVQRNQSPIQEQGIFRKSRAKTGPRSSRQPSSVANSGVIIDGCSSLYALSCYSAEQALETQNRQLEAQDQTLGSGRTGPPSDYSA
jgi:hypothetical protein